MERDGSFSDDLIGNFTLLVTGVDPLSEEQVSINSLLVDQTELFPSCAVDDAKYTIEGGCEPGIALFCRYETVPALDPTGATKEEFDEICNCVNFLCSSLPSGENTGDFLDTFQQVYYSFFVVVSCVVLLVFIASVMDLLSSGDLRECRSIFLFCLLSLLYNSVQGRQKDLSLTRSVLCFSSARSCFLCQSCISFNS